MNSSRTGLVSMLLLLAAEMRATCPSALRCVVPLLRSAVVACATRLYHRGMLFLARTWFLLCPGNDPFPGQTGVQYWHPPYRSNDLEWHTTGVCLLER